VHARFLSDLGFFMTLAGRNDNGEETSTSYWMHPSIPLQFQYDVRDEYDEYIDMVAIDDDLVQRDLGGLDKPLGFIIGFSSDGPYMPFAPPLET
jgi:hypothetical protein